MNREGIGEDGTIMELDCRVKTGFSVAEVYNASGVGLGHCTELYEG